VNDERDGDSEAAPVPPDETTTKAEGEDIADEGQELERLRLEVDDLKNEVLRERAEAQNVRKRAERDVESAHKYGLERLMQALLPVKDSMDLGLDAAAQATEIETLVQGMVLTTKMFDDLFEKLNIRAVDPTGERFDPEFHQAMTTEEATAVEPGTVLRVMQKGYVLNERLLRPALVIVAKGPAQDSA